MKKKFVIGATAAILIVAVVAIIISISASPSLVLKNKDTGKVYMKIPINDGEEFSVTFVHSVNQSPVTDVYEIRHGQIYLVRTIYYDFGAGVPTELYGNQTFSFGENGEMIISNMDTYIPDLIYIVGTVSDHTLSVNGGEKISLRNTCGRNSPVRFCCAGF